jgi:hypothetical protein
MQKKLIELSNELWAAIDAARGDSPRNGWLERELWRLKSVRDGARESGVTKPERAIDGRGLAAGRRVYEIVCASVANNVKGT